MPWVDLQCVIVVFSDHTHLLFDGILYNLSGDQYLSLPYHSNNPYLANMRHVSCLFEQM